MSIFFLVSFQVGTDFTFRKLTWNFNQQSRDSRVGQSLSTNWQTLHSWVHDTNSDILKPSR